MGIPSSPVKILGKSIKGFFGYDRTCKQTNKRRLHLHIVKDKAVGKKGGMCA